MVDDQLYPDVVHEHCFCIDVTTNGMPHRKCCMCYQRKAVDWQQVSFPTSPTIYHPTTTTTTYSDHTHGSLS